MPKVQPSTASGVPDHLQSVGIQGVVSGVQNHPFPPVPSDQMPPQYAGVELPLDPMLAYAGAFWNEQRELVRNWRIHAGPPDEIRNAAGVVIRRVQKYWTRQRHVAPPGMSIEDARARGLDFYSPQAGWIRAGVKREKDSPENLGMGHLVGEIDEVVEEVAPAVPLPDAATVAG